jgi:hypothetical protein|tara:strand:- start:340 stop:462 length:123 start_codon:yes stop_codon:yes gene_type:complete
MNFQQMKMRVDFVDQPDPMDKRMKGTDATTVIASTRELIS